MIKEVNIRNFQNHRNTTLQFATAIKKQSSGVNIILGESLHGKTAILRAIKWSIKNIPRGFRFHSDFAKKKEPTEVQLILDDDSDISLSKIKSKTTYEIKTTGQTRSFEGSKVPDIIKNKINIGDINFQEQLDAHFLITSSGGKIAKAISHITQADKIIVWIKKITERLSDFRLIEGKLKTDLEEINEQLEVLKKLDKLEPVMSSLERIRAKRKKAEDKYNKIEYILDKIKDIQGQIKGRKKHLRIKGLIKQMERAEGHLEALKQQKILILKIKQAQQDIKNITQFKNKAVRQYIREIKRQKKCPTCFGQINQKNISRIKRELI